MLSFNEKKAEPDPETPFSAMMRTLAGAVKALTAGDKLANTGPLDRGTLVVCLRPTKTGTHYEPVLGTIDRVAGAAEIAVNLWEIEDGIPTIKTQRFGVGALLWPTKHELVASIVKRSALRQDGA